MAVGLPLKMQFQFFLCAAEAWARKTFSSSRAREERYRRSVVETAFETWMHQGNNFERHIDDQIAKSKSQGDTDSVLFWIDVMVSAKDFASFPENQKLKSFDEAA